MKPKTAEIPSIRITGQNPRSQYLSGRAENGSRSESVGRRHFRSFRGSLLARGRASVQVWIRGSQLLGFCRFGFYWRALDDVRELSCISRTVECGPFFCVCLRPDSNVRYETQFPFNIGPKNSGPL